MDRAKYHYSPKTGKAELCNDKNGLCPYSGYAHFYDKAQCSLFADEMNRAISKSSKNVQELIKTDWILSGEPKIFSNQSRYNYIDFKDIEFYLRDDQREWLKDKDFFIVPKSQACIQKFLGGNKYLSESIIDDVNKSIKGRKIWKNDFGKEYNKWKIIDLLDYADKVTNNIMTKQINEPNPNRTESYTLSDVWKDFVDSKMLLHSVMEINDSNISSFYIITNNKGPRRLEYDIRNGIKGFYERGFEG